MKKKENVIIIIVAVICILLIFIVTMFVTNKLKSKNVNNTTEKSTEITTTTPAITTKATTTTTTSAPIDMQDWLKENEFELFNKDDVDYTKKLETYTIDMSTIDMSLSDFNFKELNYENISKSSYSDNWKFSKDKIELSGFSDKERLTISNNYEKALYKETTAEGDIPIYDIILFYRDQKIKFYHAVAYCGEEFDAEKTVNYVNSNEVYYNYGLSLLDARWSCGVSGLSGIYLKNNSGDYYNLVDNNIIYKENLLKDVLWHDASIIITNQNEVYYRSKKVENLKFLALIYSEDLFDPNDNIEGIISSDYYYYQINDDKLKLERKKIKNIYITKKEMPGRISKPHIIMEFEDGTYSTYSDDIWLADFVDDINYLKNL